MPDTQIQMTQPNATANSNSFEFEALTEARNYREYLIREFKPFLSGDVIEVGTGIGQMTEILVQLAAIKRLIAIEPDADFCAKHRANFPKHELIEGTIENLEAGSAWNSILSINVLEHIQDDEGELRRYAALLRERHGMLCLFVPARPEIYAPIDKDFGHFRRYTKPELAGKLKDAGFEVEKLYYYNLPGYFAWWLNFCILKKRAFEIDKVRFYDRVILPLVYFKESRIMRPPFGQSLLAVARSV